MADLPRLRASLLRVASRPPLICPSQALLDATRFRANISRSDACNTCFSRYCYNGTTDAGSVTPSGGGGGTSTGSGASPSASAKNSGAERLGVGAALAVVALIGALVVVV